MKNFFKILFAGSLMLAVTILVFINSTVAQGDSQETTVVEVVNSNDETSDFAQLLDQSGFAQVVEQSGPFTVLAPSNAALEAEGIDPDNTENAKKIVQPHLYQGNVSADQVESQMGVTVKNTDNSASNGIVYTVDAVVKR